MQSNSSPITTRSSPLYDRLIDGLIARRQQLGLTQWHVNFEIGCADSLVAKWEARHKYPNFRHLLLWCHVLDLELHLKERSDG